VVCFSSEFLVKIASKEKEIENWLFYRSQRIKLTRLNTCVIVLYRVLSGCPQETLVQYGMTMLYNTGSSLVSFKLEH